MRRVTIEDLEVLVSRINKAQGLPNESHRRKGQVFVPNPGVYTLELAYGQAGLAQMCEGGGVTTIFTLRSKRELAEQLRAYLAGMSIKPREVS